ncbi:MAG: EscU/YscU/HrcU family type III secretion system export apparatus switch protein [Candidatus Hydrogenedentes bacterium]|nr:EscU/YscU/HrcU family type III secretion system export apparatus switch protein [Candidatus Hydrogenedentota bacterium]
MHEDKRIPRRKAVAMRYDMEADAAPRVVAKGEGFAADRILALAAEHGIAVHSDPDLVQMLSQLDLQAAIPEHLYRAVAGILAFVYKMNKSI